MNNLQDNFFCVCTEHVNKQSVVFVANCPTFNSVSIEKPCTTPTVYDPSSSKDWKLLKGNVGTKTVKVE